MISILGIGAIVFCHMGQVSHEYFACITPFLLPKFSGKAIIPDTEKE